MVEPYKNTQELDHSRPFKVHTWSNYPEVNAFIDQIYNDHLSDLSRISKGNLKPLLLDLYVCWYYDPDMVLAVHRDTAKYKKGTRYRAIHVSPKMITVMDILEERGFIYRSQALHFPEEGIGRITRIWPTDKLINLFENATFDIFAIGLHPRTETVVMHDADKNDIEYKDNRNTSKWRKDLAKYNKLLEETYIDIANLEEPYIDRKPKRGSKKNTRISINQQNKHVFRVFNEDWSHGGRFYGSWWQSIGKDYRKHIRINNERTIEIDYSGFHIALLYAQSGVNYFQEYGLKADPYDIHVPEINDPDYKRWVIKQLMLFFINCSSEDEAIKVMQTYPTPDNQNRPEGLVLSNVLLRSILDQLKAKHSEISDHFCTGVGSKLQNIDSRMTYNLINTFTNDQIPLLTIHDSYIVAEQHTEFLFSEMLKEWKAVALKGKHIKGTGLASIETDLAYTGVKQLGYRGEAYDIEEERGGKKHIKAMELKEKELKPCKGYLQRLSLWNRWLERNVQSSDSGA